MDEVFSAVTILLPSYICIRTLTVGHARDEIVLASIGCLLHAPWSFMLHMYKAYNPDGHLKRTLYILDISGIHLHSLLTGYSWYYMFGTYEQLQMWYHIACIIHHITYGYDIEIQPRIELMIATGVALSAYPMIYTRPVLWVISQIIWGVAFWIHMGKVCGSFSGGIMHILLCIPQYCILQR